MKTEPLEIAGGFAVSSFIFDLLAYLVNSRGEAATIDAAQYCAAARQKSAHVFEVERSGARLSHQTFNPVFYADDFPPVYFCRRLDHCPDDRVKPRRIAAACEHSYSLSI